MSKTFKRGHHVEWNSEAGRVHGTVVNKVVPKVKIQEQCEVTAADHEVAKAFREFASFTHSSHTWRRYRCCQAASNSDPRRCRRFPAAFQMIVCYRKVKLPKILHQHDVGFGELVLHVDERLPFR